jgi:hypothetical protein
MAQNFNKQKTYLDALELANIWKTNQQNKFGNTSTFLFSEFNNITSKYGTYDELQRNPFIRGFFVEIVLGTKHPDKTNPNKPSVDTVSTFAKYIPTNLASAALQSANWQASAINGLATFMAGRFKQEVLHLAIDQIFTEIKDQKSGEIIKSVFPKTYKQVTSLQTSGSYYTADLQLLRQTAQIDIQSLPKNFSKNPETFFPSMAEKPVLKDILVFGNHVFEFSRQGQSLDHLISSLANEKYSSNPTVYKILNIIDLVSQAFLNKKGSQNTWINPFELVPSSIASFNDLELRYFYGLLYQQLIQIPELKSIININDSDDILEISRNMQSLIRFVNKLNLTYDYLRTLDFKLKTPSEIITYVKQINEIVASFNTSLPSYSNICIADSIINISDKYISLVEAILEKEYQKVIPLFVIEFADSFEKYAKSSRTLIFISQLATINNEKDMEILLNSHALPIGSSSIKRHSNFNISVNGYVGLTGGWEKAYGTQANQVKGNIGLSAPIGISTTFRKGKTTLFMSLLDLGSIVNQRLNNDTTTFTNLRFEHFFTPGLGIFWNLSKLPISFGVHFNYIPNLRTIKYETPTATITETNRSVTRLNFSLLVDIPFFTLYNKERPR